MQDAVCREIALAQQLFLLQTRDTPGDKVALKAALLADVFSNGASRLVAAHAASPPLTRFLPRAAADLAPFYIHCCERLGWSVDAAKLEAMQARNAQTLTELDNRCGRAALALLLCRASAGSAEHGAALQGGGRGCQPGGDRGPRSAARQGDVLCQGWRQGACGA